MVQVAEVEQVGETTPFGPNTEKSIIALAFDNPEFFSIVGRYLTHKYFRLSETQYVYAIIEKLFEDTEHIPTRDIVRDEALKNLTVDDDYEPILEVIEREADRREIPFIKKELQRWAQEAAYGQLYSEEGITAYERNDYEEIERLFEEARKITDVTTNGLTFFEDVGLIFERDSRSTLTSGFPKLDQCIEGGGPAKGECFCWMAPTGVGKSILLPHSGIACLKRGANVLHVTLELSKVKTALRYAGAISNVEIHKRFEPQYRQKMVTALDKARNTYSGDLKIFEFPPDEISVNEIYHLITQLRKQKNWHPDVLVVDYLELMISRRKTDNDKDYTRQKQVATQLRGVAKNEDMLVFTATQTNRDDPKSKNPGQVLGVNKVAESYGKMMPMDYVVSANQDADEYQGTTPQLRLFVAKNRNGKKNEVVRIKVNYQTMRMEEIKVNRLTKK